LTKLQTKNVGSFCMAHGVEPFQRQYLTIHFLYRPHALPCRPTNSVKALKALQALILTIYKVMAPPFEWNVEIIYSKIYGVPHSIRVSE